MIYPLNPPLLEFLILSIIKKQDSYGYQINQQIKGVSNLKDSTLYPVLKKLSDGGYVDTYDQPFQGRNRKYYSITDGGRNQYAYLHSEWKQFVQAVEAILAGESADSFEEVSTDKSTDLSTDVSVVHEEVSSND